MAMKGDSLGDIILGGFKGAFWGGVSAVASYAIAESISAAFPGINGHAISLFTATRAIGYRAALIKSLLHGVVRGAINVIQNGGKFISSFASAFITSAFALGRNVLGQGAIIARTAISAVIGGAASVITGGKFLSGAVSAAFVHLFNAEAGTSKKDKIVQVLRRKALKLSVNKIITSFEKLQDLPMAQKLMLMYKFFKNKSIFDFKQEGIIYRDYGNFVYGAVGAALGIPRVILLRAAGWAQIRAGTSNPSYGTPYDILPSSYGDDPIDQKYIEYGIGYYRNQYVK